MILDFFYIHSSCIGYLQCIKKHCGCMYRNGGVSNYTKWIGLTCIPFTQCFITKSTRTFMNPNFKHLHLHAMAWWMTLMIDHVVPSYMLSCLWWCSSWHPSCHAQCIALNIGNVEHYYDVTLPAWHASYPRVNLKLKCHMSTHVLPMGMAGPIANASETHPFFKTCMVIHAWASRLGSQFFLLTLEMEPCMH